MATRIIIDGYNLIGVRTGLGVDLQEERERLIGELGIYRRIKGHSIVLVFDGWKSGKIYECQETIKGVTVVFSRRGEKADQVIQRLASRKGSGFVVVSSDRAVQDEVRSEGAVAITSEEFDERLRMAAYLHEEIENEEEREATLTTKKKGNPRRPSKKERKKRKKLEKL